LGYNTPMGANPEFSITNPQPLLIVISGPSGVGKDTVVQRMQERGMPFHFVITATTRPKRDNEVNGVDYFFVNKEEFARMIEQNELIEYAFVYNDYKGIPKQQVREALASGKDVVMRLDVQGAETVRKLAPEKPRPATNWPCASQPPEKNSCAWRLSITSLSTRTTNWTKPSIPYARSSRQNITAYGTERSAYELHP
jgi:hypothetical protein